MDIAHPSQLKQLTQPETNPLRWFPAIATSLIASIDKVSNALEKVNHSTKHYSTKLMNEQQFQLLVEEIRSLTSQMQRIADVAEATKIDKPRMGLGDNLAPLTLSVKRTKDYCWEARIKGVSLPVEENEVCGKAIGLKIKEADSPEWGEIVRIHLTLMADRPYVIDVGKNTVFSRQMLFGLYNATEEQLGQPITLVAEPSQKEGSKAEKIVFCSMYDSKHQQIRTITKEEDDMDWERVLSLVLRKFNKPRSGEAPIDREKVMGEIGRQLEQLGWSVGDAKSYVERAYGVRSRSQMTDTQLMEFLGVLSTRLTENHNVVASRV